MTGNLVALLPIPPDAVTAGGIHRVDSNQPQQIWRVLHVGPGRLTKKGVRIPIEFKPGDRVVSPEILVSRDCYTDGVKICDASEIIAKVEE